MPRFTIAQIQPPRDGAAAGATQQVSISATTATVLVAAIGIVPALTTALVDWTVKSPLAAEVQRAEITVKAVEADTKKATADLDERRLEEVWLRSALSMADENKRAEALKFLVSSGLVAHDFKAVGSYAHPPEFPIAAATPTPQTTK